MARRTTSPTSAGFFDLVARAAFCNPFADEYLDFCRRIGGSDDSAAAGAVVAARVDALATAGRAELRLYRGSEQETMRLVFLYLMLTNAFAMRSIRSSSISFAPVRHPFRSRLLPTRLCG
jgi:hypothetical protein